MTAFVPGDRVCIRCTGDDGLPLVRYGYYGGCCHDDGTITILLDDDVSAVTMTDSSQVEPVTVTSIELRLAGADLFWDAPLRRGLVDLWRAEAESAGLDIDALHHLGDGLRDSSDSFALAELTAGACHYVLRAICEPNAPETVRVRADQPNRWDL